MKWKDILSKGGARRHQPVERPFHATLEDLGTAARREETAIRQMENLVYDRVVGGYPYPQHLPPATAAYQRRQQHIPQQTRPPYPAPPGYIPPPPVAEPEAPTVNVNVSVPVERIISVSCGIGISIAGLFAYIFRNEVIKYGTVAGVLVVAWKFGQWHATMNLHNREQEMVREGRLNPAQPNDKQYAIQQAPRLQGYPQIDFMPGR
jgi:hypothetical protein